MKGYFPGNFSLEHGGIAGKILGSRSNEFFVMSQFLDENAAKRTLKEPFPCLPGVSEVVTGNFEADSVLSIAGKNGIIPERVPTSFWHAFQTSGESFDEEFKALIFSDALANHSDMIVSDVLGRQAVHFKRSARQQEASLVKKTCRCRSSMSYTRTISAAVY